MKEIKLSVNMESYRIGFDIVKKKEITEEQFHMADKGGLTNTATTSYDSHLRHFS